MSGSETQDLSELADEALLKLVRSGHDTESMVTKFNKMLRSRKSGLVIVQRYAVE